MCERPGHRRLDGEAPSSARGCHPWRRRGEPGGVGLATPAGASSRRPATGRPPGRAPIVVHLSGEIVVPGIYQLPVGARVDDALRAAGGVTPNGDVNRLNLAARLADGQHVVVPRKADPVTMSVTAAASPAALRVNVNSATVAELDGLPGVGPVTAQRIVAYRQQHGPFTRIDELREAKLVNQATFDKIKDLISV